MVRIGDPYICPCPPFLLAILVISHTPVLKTSIYSYIATSIILIGTDIGIKLLPAIWVCLCIQATSIVHEVQ